MIGSDAFKPCPDPLDLIGSDAFHEIHLARSSRDSLFLQIG
jgi:hypothetical protein